jgi:hypothetical protein
MIRAAGGEAMVAAGDVSTADDVNGITVRTIGQFERLAHVFNKRISKVHVGRSSEGPRPTSTRSSPSTSKARG